MNLIERLLESFSGETKELPELMKQRKICYPGYLDSEFASLKDAVQYFKKKGYNMEYRLPDIIMYNVCYRDYLRNYGMEMLLKRLVKDVPELAKDEKLLHSLQKWYDKEGKNLSEYDIQCYNIKDTITVLGHEFHGLEDVKAYRNACGCNGYSRIYFRECTPEKIIPDLYVCEFYEPYPTFDACDRAYENRTFQNYLFTSEPINEDKLKRILDMGYGSNYRMVREGIPGEMLPLLYYEGEGNYMLFAHNK